MEVGDASSRTAALSTSEAHSCPQVLRSLVLVGAVPCYVPRLLALETKGCMHSTSQGTLRHSMHGMLQLQSIGHVLSLQQS